MKEGNLVLLVAGEASAGMRAKEKTPDERLLRTSSKISWENEKGGHLEKCLRVLKS